MHDRLIGLAEEFGTPLYVYDLDAMADRAKGVAAALGDGIELLFAAKANPNPAVLASARGWARGLDVSSGGEIEMAISAGWQASDLSLAGPGKSESELDLAVGVGCGSISAESLDDLESIVEAGRRTSRRPRVSLRINPLELKGAFALKMGGRPTQFGVDEEAVPEAAARIAAHAGRGELEYAGIHIYAGTQCLEAEAIVANVENSLRIARETEALIGMAAPSINLGGGFGIPYYEGQDEVDLQGAARGISEATDRFAAERGKTRFKIELGRYLAAPAGWYLTSTLAVKNSRGKTFAIVDGGMHHNLSASGNLGQTIKRNYRIRNLSNPDGEVGATEVAGCLCTPIDLLGFGAPLPAVRRGDLLCLDNSGAYGLTASPLLFLGHETPREVAIENGKARLVRERRSAASMA